MVHVTITSYSLLPILYYYIYYDLTSAYDVLFNFLLIRKYNNAIPDVPV
jgi:hypothetical protein